VGYLVDDRVTEAAPIVGLSTREERVRRAIASFFHLMKPRLGLAKKPAMGPYV
jgi:hypothetical protein